MAHTASSHDGRNEAFTTYPRAFRTRTSASAPNSITPLSSQNTRQLPPILQVFFSLSFANGRTLHLLPSTTLILLTTLLSSKISPLTTQKMCLSGHCSPNWDWCRHTHPIITDIKPVTSSKDSPLLFPSAP